MATHTNIAVGLHESHIITEVALDQPLVLSNVDTDKISSVVIMLHGIGSSAMKDFEQLIKYCPDLSTRILVFPNAPERHIKLFKRDMRAWSDILSGDFENGSLDWSSFRKNVEDLSIMVESIKIIYGIPKIIVGGFSQGGFNVWAGIQSLCKETTGMAIFSTAINKEFTRNLKFDMADYPLLYSYGQEDILMPAYFCEKSQESVMADFNSTNFTCYQGGHGHEIDQSAAELFWKWEENL